MKITDETIEYVAALARLSLTTDQKEKAREDLERILTFMDSMNELDTDGIEPMSHAFPITNVFRDDVVTNQENREELLANAPAKKDGCFLVPKTVE